MPTPTGPCYLPECVLTAVGSYPSDILTPDYPQFPGEGGGGYPQGLLNQIQSGLSRFQHPRGPAKTGPVGPVFTPKPRAPPAPLPVPPGAPPPPPPPPTPVGEPPIDEPPYGSYDENVFDQYTKSLVERFLSKVFPEGIDYMFLSKILSGAGDIFNLATYTADLGPTLAEEQARVGATLQNQPPGGLPFADPITAGLIQQIAAEASAALPNIEGFPAPVRSPTDVIPGGIVVSAPRVRPSPNPLAEPYLAPVSSPFLQPGFPSPFAAVKPLVGFGTAPAPAPAGRTAPALRPRLGQPSGLARPDVFQRPGLRPGSAVGPGYAQSPLEGTQPGVAPNQTDCQATDTKQKKKQPRKKRNVCYRGTYEERANGLLKWRKERIQCR